MIINREFVIQLILMFNGFAVDDPAKRHISYNEPSADIEDIKKFDALFCDNGYFMFKVHYSGENEDGVEVYELTCREFRNEKDD